MTVHHPVKLPSLPYFCRLFRKILIQHSSLFLLSGDVVFVCLLRVVCGNGKESQNLLRDMVW